VRLKWHVMLVLAVSWLWAACVQGELVLRLRLDGVEGSEWTEALVAESHPVENVVAFQLRESFWSLFGYWFSGPGSSSDWDISYYIELPVLRFRQIEVERTRLVRVPRGGGTFEWIREPYTVCIWIPVFSWVRFRINGNNFWIPPFLITHVSAEVRERGAPDEYLLETFRVRRVSCFFPARATAEISLLVPGDLMLRAADTVADPWTGYDALAAAEQPTQTEQVLIQSADGGQTASYEIRLLNVKNASVSYRLRQWGSSGGPQIVRYYGPDGAEITDQITSPEGYATPTLLPFEEFIITAKATPVSSERGFRDVTVSVKVVQVTAPPFQLTPFSRFDAVKARTNLEGLVKVRTGRWREGH